MQSIVKRIWIPLLIAVLMWLIGVFRGVEKTSDGTGYTYREQDGFHGLFQETFFDLAIAILIAVVVSELVERAHERRLRDSEKASVHQTMKQMFRTFFGSFFSDEMIAEAIDGIFSSRLVRDSMWIEYSFSRHPRSKQLLVMQIIMEYVIENISDITERFEPNVMLPNIMANYPDDAASEKPVVLGVLIGEDEFDADRIKALNEMIKGDDVNPLVPLGKYEIPHNTRMKVRTQFRLIKLVNQAETMRMIFPTRNATIEVINNYGPSLSIKIAEIHRRPFPKPEYTTTDKTRWSWQVSRMFLPNNGWVLYWNDLSRNISGLQRRAAPKPPAPAVGEATKPAA